MNFQTKTIRTTADLPGGVREQGASISRLRRTFPRDDPTHTASQPAMTIPPTALTTGH